MSTFKFILACAAVEAPVPPSGIGRSAIPVIEPPLIKTELAFCVAIVPRPKEDLAVAPISVIYLVPSPTIIAPSLGVKLEI